MTDTDLIAKLETQLAEKDAVLESATALINEKDAALKVAEKLVEEYKPTVDVSGFLMETVDDVKARFSESQIRDLAEREFAEVNRTRLKAGYSQIEFDEEAWEQAIDETIDDLLADRRRDGANPTGPLMRVMKMMKPDGILVQIPYENQINNLAGSIADAIQRYKDKGFKLVTPDLCPSQNCWELAAIENGLFIYGRYCSQDHQKRTEGTQNEGVEGAITRAMMAG